MVINTLFNRTQGQRSLAYVSPKNINKLQTFHHNQVIQKYLLSLCKKSKSTKQLIQELKLVLS